MSSAPINIAEKEAIKHTKELYLELLEFKSETHFHEVGFGLCCSYNNGLIRVRNLRGYTNADKHLLPKGIVVGDLEMLGMEYMRSKGVETEFTIYTNKNFRQALDM